MGFLSSLLSFNPFKSKYKTTVATTITRVIEDNALPESVKTGALKSIMQSDEQMIENSLEELVNGIGIRANRMYDYGKNHYVFGLPKSTQLTAQSSMDVVKGVLEGISGAPIVYDYFNYGAFNNMHFAWVQIQNVHGYNGVTNELEGLSAIKGHPVYLKDMVVVVAEVTLQEMDNGSLAQWGIQACAGPSPDRPNQDWAMGKLRLPTPFEVNNDVNSDYIRVEYCWLDSASALHTESMNITVAGMDDTASYYQVRYLHSGIPYYWLYKDNSGGYPIIDVLYSPEYEATGSYFPWTYFRFNRENPSAHMDSEEYKSSKKLMKYLNINYQHVVDGIHGNPDISQVEQAMLMMAVPANTSNELEIRYLYEYFKAQFAVTGGVIKAIVKPSGSFIWKYLDSSVMDGSVLIQDARFKMGMGFRNIFVTRVAGKLGPVGTFTSSAGRETVTQQGTPVGDTPGATWTDDVNYHIYRKQITPSMYEEVRVINLNVVYHIYNEYSTTADETSEILMIPLDKSITDHFSIPDREKLFARSLHYVFNSRVTTEIKWYQSSLFKYVLIIIAIIITYFTWGSTVKLLIAAIAIGTVSAILAVLYIVLIKLLEQFLLAYAIKLFVHAVGVKVGLIVAVIAVIYGGYSAIQAGSIQGAPWAQELLQVATGITSGIQNEIKTEFLDLQKESEEFNLFVTHEKQKIKDAEALLNNSIRVSPLIIFGETPQEYFQRTVHSGNIGALGIDAISSFADVHLTLPTLTETLGDEYNG